MFPTSLHRLHALPSMAQTTMPVHLPLTLLFFLHFSSCTFNAAHVRVSNHTPSLTAVSAGAGDSGQPSATEANAVTPSGSASTPSGAPSGTMAPSSEAAPSGTMATSSASSPEGSASAGSSSTSSGGQTSTVTDTLTWLRGIVQTDEDGIAEFETIVPGWYSGRAPHIHIKVTACGSQSTCASLVAHIDHFHSHFAQILYSVFPLLYHVCTMSLKFPSCAVSLNTSNSFMTIALVLLLPACFAFYRFPSVILSAQQLRLKAFFDNCRCMCHTTRHLTSTTNTKTAILFTPARSSLRTLSTTKLQLRSLTFRTL